MRRMILAMFMGLLVPSVANAELSTTIGYNGVLLKDGVGFSHAGLTMTFRLFETEAAEAAVWFEVHPAVPIDAGFYHVELGGTDAQKAIELRLQIVGERWLEVDADGIGTLAPRIRLSAAPFAWVSQTLAQPSSGAYNVPGDARVAGKVGIGTASPQGALDLNGDFRVASGEHGWYIQHVQNSNPYLGFAPDGDTSKQFIMYSDGTLQVNGNANFGSYVSVGGWGLSSSSPDGSLRFGTTAASDMLVLESEGGVTAKKGLYAPYVSVGGVYLGRNAVTAEGQTKCSDHCSAEGSYCLAAWATLGSKLDNTAPGINGCDTPTEKPKCLCAWANF